MEDIQAVVTCGKKQGLLIIDPDANYIDEHAQNDNRVLVNDTAAAKMLVDTMKHGHLCWFLALILYEIDEPIAKSYYTIIMKQLERLKPKAKEKRNDTNESKS